MASVGKREITKSQQATYINALTNELPVLRAKIGISQGELASLVGVSRQTYSAIECGKRMMSWGTFMSLILFFDYNIATHETIRNINAFPDEVLDLFNDGEGDPRLVANTIAGIPSSITEKLDERAMHTIRLVVMMEYARCVDLPGDEVVKAFDGKAIQRLSDRDIRTIRAIKNIREGKRPND